MKKHLLLSTLCMLMTCAVFAQVPQAICFQAAAKDPTGADLISQSISIRASIVNNGPTGNAEWQETHNVTTDAFGLFTINVGQGIYTGGNQTEFKNIPWGTGTFWLRIEMDAQGGSNYQLMGANQILSVPYALYSEGSTRADHATTADAAITAQVADTSIFALNAINDADGDPLNELQTLDYQNGQLALVAPDGTTSGSVDIPINNDPDPANEIQTLEYQNGELSLLAPDGTSSGSINLPVDNDPDPANEIQTLEYQNDTLKLVDANGNSPGGGGGFFFPEDNDIDDTNEIQELVVDSNGMLSITGGTTLVNLQGNPLNAPGSSVDFPLGVAGDHIVLTDGQYQVPDDKIFFILAGGPTIKLLNVGPPPFVLHPTTPNMPIINEEVVIENCMCTGVLVDTTFLVTPVVLDFMTDINTYTVPDNKILFIKSGLKNDQPAKLRINNADMEFLRPSFTRGTRIMSFPENTIIQPIPNPFGVVDIILTGYLLDKAAFVFSP